VKRLAKPKLSNQQPVDDPHHAAAVARRKAAVKKLQSQGIIDRNGRRIRKTLPADMRESFHRDLSGERTSNPLCVVLTGSNVDLLKKPT